jgi:nucleoid DNA-binding protein
VIKLDIVNQVADKTGVPKAKAEVAVEALFEAMKVAAKGSSCEALVYSWSSPARGA